MTGTRRVWRALLALRLSLVAGVGPTLHCDGLRPCRFDDGNALVQVQLRTSAAGNDTVQSQTSAAANDTVYHLHVPKVAGISFASDIMKILKKSGVKLASREGCYDWQEGNPRIRGTAVMLRKPRGHALSQFNFCRMPLISAFRRAVQSNTSQRMPAIFDDWVRSWTRLKDDGWHGDFTPLSGRPRTFVERTYRFWRTLAWGRPPFSPEATRLNPADWPQLDGGGTCWHSVLMPFQCYVPLSLQAQRLSCHKPMDYSRMPDAQTAIKNMQAAWFVGLVEAYQASMCLFRVKLEHKLPKYCNCSDSKRWKSFRASSWNQFKHRKQNTSEEVLQLMDGLTAADRLLYEAARERFVSEVQEVEQVYSTKFFCQDEEQTLRL